MGQVKIIEVKSEIGAGTRGAHLGIDAIKKAAKEKNEHFFESALEFEIETENESLNYPITSPFAKRIVSIVRIYERVCNSIHQSLLENNFPLVIAGDHASAGGTIAGIKKAYPNLRLGVVWIDAHADLHSPYTTPSGNLHGMPVATALGVDNLEHQKNVLCEETITAWEQLKHMGEVYPKVKAEDLVYVAVRDTELEENEIIKKLDIRNFTVNEVRKFGTRYIVNSIQQKLRSVDMIYISFDVDSMDKNISTGTGTPVEGGLTIEEASSLIMELVALPKAICFELVEVNPLLDNKGNLMAEIAFDIIQKAYKIIMKK